MVWTQPSRTPDGTMGRCSTATEALCLKLAAHHVVGLSIHPFERHILQYGSYIVVPKSMCRQRYCRKFIMDTKAFRCGLPVLCCVRECPERSKVLLKHALPVRRTLLHLESQYSHPFPAIIPGRSSCRYTGIVYTFHLESQLPRSKIEHSLS